MTMDVMAVTVEEAGRRLGISRNYAYILVRRGELRSFKMGRLRRVAVSEIAAFMERRMPKAG